MNNDDQSNTTDDQPIEIEENDALISDNGRHIRILSIDDDTVVCKDSGRIQQKVEHDIGNVSRAAASDDFKIIRDSDLTAIPGVGDATAPEVEARTGCSTPDELVEEMFTNKDSVVLDSLRRPDKFKSWAAKSIDSIDVQFTVEQMKVMFFIINEGCKAKLSDISNMDITTTHGKVRASDLTFDAIDWNEDGKWTNNSMDVAVVRSHSSLKDFQDTEMWDELKQCDNHTEDGDNKLFTVDGSETLVSGQTLDDLRQLFDFNLKDVKCHPNESFPVLIPDSHPKSNLLIAIAPRIRT